MRTSMDRQMQPVSFSIFTKRLRSLRIRVAGDHSSAYGANALADNKDRSILTLRQRYQETLKELSTEAIALMRDWPARKEAVRTEEFSYQVRGKEVTGANYRESLSHQKIPKIAAPSFRDWGEMLAFLMKENLPGAYPYTGGVYPYRRLGEDPTRMFAGEGTPERTNRAFPLPVQWAGSRQLVDGIRFRDLVWRGPARTAGYLRQGRQFRRVDRVGRRHEEAVFRL